MLDWFGAVDTGKNLLLQTLLGKVIIFLKFSNWNIKRSQELLPVALVNHLDLNRFEAEHNILAVVDRVLFHYWF